MVATANFQCSKYRFFLITIILSLALSLFLLFFLYSSPCLGVRWSQHGNRPFHVCPWLLSIFLAISFFPSSNTFSSISQVLGQLHGRCPRWFHERQPSQWHADHYSSQEVHGTDTHHLSPGQKAQTGLPPSHGRGRGAGQPPGGGRTLWGSVPWVGSIRISMLIKKSFQQSTGLIKMIFVILVVFPVSDLLS